MSRDPGLVDVAPSVPAPFADATMTRPVGERPATRIAWLDTARALSVLTIVLFHLAASVVDSLDSRTSAIGLVWRTGAYLLSGLRLPLLLLVSGVVLSRQVRGGFSRSTTVYRLTQVAYLYVLWTTVYWLVLGRSPSLMRLVSWERHDWVTQLYSPATPVWYLGGLALSLLVATAALRLGPWPLLGAGALAAVWATSLNLVHYVSWRAVPAYALFFFVGVVVGRRVAWIETIRTKTAWWAVGGLFSVYGLLMVAAKTWAAGLAAGAITVVASFAGLGAVLLVVERVSRLDRVRRVGTTIGRRTISVYLLHMLIFLPLFSSALHLLEGASRTLVLVVVPGVASALVVASAFAVESATRRLGASWLWELPAPIARRLGR